MATWVWILIAVGAAIVLGIVLYGAWKGRERRLESKRTEAQGLRRQAEQQSRRAEERSALADELAERARGERREAQVAARRADEVDPDVDD
jgi:FtsZ-interacting cell division protein ZipA